VGSSLSGDLDSGYRRDWTPALRSDHALDAQLAPNVGQPHVKARARVLPGRQRRLHALRRRRLGPDRTHPLRRSRDGVASRILRFAPGTDTTPNGIQIHDFWEEVYILEGSLTDLELGETFTAGMYACRPPGMKHGPWTSDTGA
jgi:hypothetical protein